MNHCLKLLFALLFLPLLLQAQQQNDSLRISLQDARALAIKNNPKLRASVLNIQIAEESVAQAKFNKVPLVYGDLNLRRNLIIPVTPVPANAFNPNAAEGELLPLRFSTKWTANAGINASVDVFNPQRKQEIAELKIQAEISKTQTEIDQQKLYDEVSQAYAAALIAQEQLRLAAVDTLTKSKLLTMNQEQFDAGKLLLAELNQVKTDRNMTLDKYQEAEQIAADAKAELLYYVGFSPLQKVNIGFVDSIEDLYSQYSRLTLTDTLGSLSLRKLKQDERLVASQINAAQSGFLPVISLQGYYGANYFDNNFELFKGSNWNGNSFINLGVRIPITEGFQRSRKITQLKLQNQANSLAYQDQQHKNQLDVLSAEREALRFQEKYKRAVDNFRMAGENFRNAEAQYLNGRLLIGEFYQQSYTYQLEKNNYLNVMYNYLMARLKQESAARN